MFYTEFEPLENAFVLKVRYDLMFKKWAFRYYEELIVFRSRMESLYVDKDLEQLAEEMK